VHHKFRVRLDGERAGVDAPPRLLRDAMLAALRAEGLEVVLWQTAPLPAHPLFRAAASGRTWPWSADRETEFDALYDPARFPRTTRLLDRSLLLFSQSYPLIAQTAALVDRYAETFARVWKRRGELALRATR
jgi:hypothetical protein